MSYADLLRLAGEQRGYFTTEQAETAGLSRRALNHRAKLGELDHAAYGLWKLAAWPASPDEELYALQALAPFGTFSHETALAILGLGDVIPAEIHMTIPESSRLQPRPGLRLHRSRLGAERARILRDGLKVSAPRQAIEDAAAAGMDPEHLRQAINEAKDRGMLTSSDLARLASNPRTAFGS